MKKISLISLIIVSITLSFSLTGCDLLNLTGNSKSVGGIFKSYDFPTKNSYNLSLHRYTVENSDQCPYYWDLYSEPIENN